MAEGAMLSVSKLIFMGASLSKAKVICVGVKQSGAKLIRMLIRLIKVIRSIK